MKIETGACNKYFSFSLKKLNSSSTLYVKIEAKRVLGRPTEYYISNNKNKDLMNYPTQKILCIKISSNKIVLCFLPYEL